MKLSTREDIEAPIDHVFRMASDFERFERQVLRRGAEIERTDRMERVGPGMSWRLRFEYRERPRLVEAELAEFVPGNGYVIKSVSGGLNCTAQLDLVALSRARTRMILGLDIRPTTLSSRLFVQSLKFAKSSLTRKLNKRVSLFASEIGERYATA